MRILRLLEEAVFREYRRIVCDNARLYGGDFASTNSDFYTNKERRESFGCLVGNLLAQRYHFQVRLVLVDCCWSTPVCSRLVLLVVRSYPQPHRMEGKCS